MKVMYDTNVYISFIRDRSHADVMQQRGTTKYFSAIVLMELWAGSKSKASERLINRLQRPYRDAGRIVTLSVKQYIEIGHFFADIPQQYMTLSKKSSFLYDVQIAFTALSIGATLYTEDSSHFDIIQSRLNSLKVKYLP